ncbi:hypothetical protein QT381_11505 [Galbitalea sp. SE-J8]|uniref:hypothetical protein n=1 Tax=Galbitalea sp. SE-J8 TaxID=3054952 RepID=UPI00259C95B9|nr:hypothetical protein [Galbitalea sp. SE-J8]MDM4763634.1 hypothetical protein [Galbitalea sp. SE-J8]
MIRAVLFDLDDTLFAHRAAVDGGIARTITRHPELVGVDALAEVERWRALEEEHYHRYLAGELDSEGQRFARARAFLGPHGLGELVADDAGARLWWEAY